MIIAQDYFTKIFFHVPHFFLLNKQKTDFTLLKYVKQ